MRPSVPEESAGRDAEARVAVPVEPASLHGQADGVPYARVRAGPRSHVRREAAMSTRYVPIAEEARLALTGAEQRLARAKVTLADFELEHDGQVVSPVVRASVERERHCLQIELDEAIRQYQKAVQDFEEGAR